MKRTRVLRKLFKLKRAKIGFIGVAFFCLISLFSNFIASDKPIFIYSKKNGEASKIYFPIFKKYDLSSFDIETDYFILDYKKLYEDLKKSHEKTLFLFPLSKWSPSEQSGDILSRPSVSHLLGTDSLGRDVFTRLVHGIKISLLFALTLWLVSFALGVLLGAFQGYFIGVFDFTVERFKEVLLSIPMLTILLLMTTFAKTQSFALVLMTVVVFSWPQISSQIRAQVLSLRKREYCLAAKALGASHFRVVTKHIIPNCLTPIITLSPFAIEMGVTLLAILDYLGFGLPPPTPSLGELLSQGRDYIQTAPWLILSPIISMVLILISINLVGQALRDAFDPKMEK